VTPEVFIKQKALQFVYFINQVLSSSVPFKEIQLFTWDILEEWSRLDIDDSTPISAYERVFWHVFYVIQSTDAQDIGQDSQIRKELSECCRYLQQPTNPVPKGCVGLRP